MITRGLGLLCLLLSAAAEETATVSALRASLATRINDFDLNWQLAGADPCPAH